MIASLSIVYRSEDRQSLNCPTTRPWGVEKSQWKVRCPDRHTRVQSTVHVYPSWRHIDTHYVNSTRYHSERETWLTVWLPVNGVTWTSLGKSLFQESLMVFLSSSRLHEVLCQGVCCSLLADLSLPSLPWLCDSCIRERREDFSSFGLSFTPTLLLCHHHACFYSKESLPMFTLSHKTHNDIDCKSLLCVIQIKGFMVRRRKVRRKNRVLLSFTLFRVFRGLSQRSNLTPSS